MAAFASSDGTLRITQDKREIKSLRALEKVTFKVSEGGAVNRIKPYLDDGETLWFALYNSDGQIAQRVNGRNVIAVVYESTPPKEKKGRVARQKRSGKKIGPPVKR